MSKWTTSIQRLFISMMIVHVVAPWAKSQCDMPPDEIVSSADTFYVDQFGRFFDLDGDVLVVSAWQQSLEADFFAGAVYVFDRSPKGWILRQKLLPPIGGVKAFGSALAVDGEALLVTGSISGATRVFAYHHNETGWAFEQVLNNPGTNSTSFGSAMRIDQDTAFIGGDSGTIHVYHRSENLWSLEQTLTHSARGVFSFDLEGDLLAVGTYGTPGTLGNVYLFRFNGTHWLEETSFPYSASTVKLEGGKLYFRAHPGAIHEYERIANVWTLSQQLSPPDIAAYDYFANALERQDDLLIAGLSRGNNLLGLMVYRDCNGSWSPEYLIDGWSPPSNPSRSIELQGDQLYVGNPIPFLGHDGAVYRYTLPSDCNVNGLHDGCELLGSPDRDCDENVVLDECESQDCNSNGQFDLCDIAHAVSLDCNGNAMPDDCDIASGSSFDLDNNAVPDECDIPHCQDQRAGPVFSLRAVAVNGKRNSPSGSIHVREGDVVDVELFISCWACTFDLLQTYQATISTKDGATSGTHGTILPLGWDAPLEPDPCPCTDTSYPICHEFNGCVGSNHDPTARASIDDTRPDFVLNGLAAVLGIDVSTITGFRLAATADTWYGATDNGVGRYGGALHLRVGDNACGDFLFAIREGRSVEIPDACLESFVCSSQSPPTCLCPRLESVSIHVCMDDGLFCNGFESCDAELGCQITPPPSCDDGVACTVDACDELTDGCSHSLNHAACDDGNVCTRDECTPTGCSNIDDQCGDIPTTSNWGLVILALSFLIMAKWRSIRAARNWNT